MKSWRGRRRREGRVFADDNVFIVSTSSAETDVLSTTTSVSAVDVDDGLVFFRVRVLCSRLVL